MKELLADFVSEQPFKILRHKLYLIVLIFDCILIELDVKRCKTIAVVSWKLHLKSTDSVLYFLVWPKQSFCAFHQMAKPIINNCRWKSSSVQQSAGKPKVMEFLWMPICAPTVLRINYNQIQVQEGPMKCETGGV